MVGGGGIPHFPRTEVPQRRAPDKVMSLLALVTTHAVQACNARQQERAPVVHKAQMSVSARLTLAEVSTALTLLVDVASVAE